MIKEYFGAKLGEIGETWGPPDFEYNIKIIILDIRIYNKCKIINLLQHDLIQSFNFKYGI